MNTRNKVKPKNKKSKHPNDLAQNQNEINQPKASLFKKACLGFLIITVIGVSINNGILALNATFYYKIAGFPWFEWVNYLFLSLFLLICPILALFYLDSIHVRRGLRLFLFGMSLSKVTEVFAGPIEHFSTLFQYQRPWNALYLPVEFAALIICWLFLLRQIRGESLLPIPVNTNRKGAFSWWRNLKNFMKNPYPQDNKKLKIVLFINTLLFLGVFITMIPENTQITLEKPEHHQMEIKFWGGGADDFENDTLEILGENNITICGWIGIDDIDRYSRFNISTYKVKDIPKNEDPEETTQFYQDIDFYMDMADSKPLWHGNFKGFIADYENLDTIARFNETSYCEGIENITAGIEYIRSRGYEYSICETMHNLGDFYDNDPDVDVVYNNPFAPVQFENITSINWMVYRSEKAILYDEPYEYFTYQWASHITRYLHHLEDQYGYPRGFWANRSGMSIGVSRDALYTYNSDLRGFEASLEELIKDAQIAYSCGIGDVTVFYLRHFVENWGNEGLVQFIEETRNFETVSFKYKRRATYFGNLKWASNVNGSVFGLFFCDGLYSNWFGFLALIWIILLVVVPIGFMFRKMDDPSKLRIGKKGREEKKQEVNESIDKIADKSDIILRSSFFVLLGLILIWTFLVAEIFVFSKEVVLWAPWYWEEVAMDDPGFQQLWQEITSKYIYYGIGGLFAILATGWATLRHWDKKHKEKAQ